MGVHPGGDRHESIERMGGHTVTLSRAMRTTALAVAWVELAMETPGQTSIAGLDSVEGSLSLRLQSSRRLFDTGLILAGVLFATVLGVTTLRFPSDTSWVISSLIAAVLVGGMALVVPLMVRGARDEERVLAALRQIAELRLAREVELRRLATTRAGRRQMKRWASL